MAAEGEGKPRLTLESGNLSKLCSRGTIDTFSYESIGHIRTKDVNRAVQLIDALLSHNSVPAENLQKLKDILQSDFCKTVREVYENVYDTVEIDTGNEEITAQATAKATVAAFAASEGHSHPRIIELAKGEEGLGFNVMGGKEQNSQIYVSRIIPGGVAERDGRLQRGDQILTINGKTVENEYHERAVQTLKSAQGKVTLVVKYAPKLLEEMEQRFDPRGSRRPNNN